MENKGMNAANVGKVMDALCNVTQLAANLSDNVKEGKNMINTIPRNTDDSNNNESNPNQNVQIHIGDLDKKKEEPVVIHEKPETHIHKEFPDERSLTDKECDLALQKAKMENDLKVREMEYRKLKDEQDRRDRQLREEYERKKAEEREAQRKKESKVGKIIGGVLAALGVGLIGYGIYDDNRRYKAAVAAGNIPQPGASLKIDKTVTTPLISAEGSVE